MHISSLYFCRIDKKCRKLFKPKKIYTLHCDTGARASRLDPVGITRILDQYPGYKSFPGREGYKRDFQKYFSTWQTIRYLLKISLPLWKRSAQKLCGATPLPLCTPGFKNLRPLFPLALLSFSLQWRCFLFFLGQNLNSILCLYIARAPPILKLTKLVRD